MSDTNSNSASKSGFVSLENDRLHWFYENRLVLTIDLSNVAVLGEYTTANGPWEDDWFLVFVYRDGKFFHLPFYVEGFSDLMAHLQKRFSSSIGALVGSTKWATIIDYPAQIEGKELFQLKSDKNYRLPKNIFEKFLYYGFGIGKFNTDQEIVLSEDVRSYLKIVNR